jgi:hypothetical protein
MGAKGIEITKAGQGRRLTHTHHNNTNAPTQPRKHDPSKTKACGALYTLNRERWDFNRRMVAFRLVLEHLQVFAIVLRPAAGLGLPYGGALWWRVVGGALFAPAAAGAGYQASAGARYGVAGAVVVAAAALCRVAYVYKRDGGHPYKTKCVCALLFHGSC